MPRNKGRTVATIDLEIQRLQKERDEALTLEIAGVVARIKEAIAHYGLTAADLGLDGSPSRGAGDKSKRTVRAKRHGSRSSSSGGRNSTPKYADGKGHTWTGVGKRPRWYLDAIAAGSTSDDLLVTPSTS